MFTGQQEIPTIGLYFYNSRFYDAALGRFVSPDSIIPQQQGTQAWDRYAGMNNNPIRYTDPTGHFSNDEIKKFLGFDEDDPWENILELFEEGGKYEGRWGWLEILRKAELGDRISIDWARGSFPEGHPDFVGPLTFRLDAQGNLILSGDGFYFDHEVAGLFGDRYELTHYTDNNGKKVAAAFLVIATDVTIGIPGVLMIITGNPVLMRAGEYLEYTVVLPVNILGVKIWMDAENELFETITVPAIPSSP